MSDLQAIDGLVRSLADSPAGERTEILRQLVPLVYGELKSLARMRRAGWRGPDDPGTTSLVHEAYARIAVQKDPRYRDRRQFYAVASKAMRSILVDNARWHRREKRGGGAEKVPFEEFQLVSAARSAEVLALDFALAELERADDELARVVELRCFGGASVEETAEALGVSAPTVKRRWRLAKAWLHRAMTRAKDE